jgi:uncharacterized membrane protein YebE (DUF533 family)
MSAQKMLEQLLKSGLSMMDESKGSGTKGEYSKGRKSDSGLGKIGVGSASGGLLGMLLGSKRGQGMGGTALKVGGVAALGAAAFKAYTYWQTQQAPQNAHSSSENQASQTVPGSAPQGTEEQSQALLKAMIAAAKSDGHLDERERSLIHAELDRLQADPQLRQWMEDELRRPLDPAEVARAASTPELGAEMYLASLLMVDSTSFMERAYLDELARQLQLAPMLKSELERSVRAY